MANVLVELSRDDEVLRRATTNTGGFHFGGLRPGRWRLRVDDHNLPAHHRLTQSEMVLDLAAGDRTEICIRAVPETRYMTIVDSAELEVQ